MEESGKSSEFFLAIVNYSKHEDKEQKQFYII